MRKIDVVELIIQAGAFNNSLTIYRLDKSEKFHRSFINQSVFRHRDEATATTTTTSEDDGNFFCARKGEKRLKRDEEIIN